MKLSERGAASRSYLIAVTAVIVAVVGYVGWWVVRPDPYSLSERIVRDARREVAAEVRDFQRQLDIVVRGAKRDQQDAGAAIDKTLADALQGIDDVVDGARDRLSELDINIRSQRNRLDRIDNRADEARKMVNEFAAEAREKARGS